MKIQVKTLKDERDIDDLEVEMITEWKIGRIILAVTLLGSLFIAGIYYIK